MRLNVAATPEQEETTTQILKEAPRWYLGGRLGDGDYVDGGDGDEAEKVEAEKLTQWLQPRCYLATVGTVLAAAAAVVVGIHCHCHAAESVGAGCAPPAAVNWTCASV